MVLTEKFRFVNLFQRHILLYRFFSFRVSSFLHFYIRFRKFYTFWGRSYDPFLDCDIFETGYRCVFLHFQLCPWIICFLKTDIFWWLILIDFEGNIFFTACLGPFDLQSGTIFLLGFILLNNLFFYSHLGFFYGGRPESFVTWFGDIWLGKSFSALFLLFF